MTFFATKTFTMPLALDKTLGLCGGIPLYRGNYAYQLPFVIMDEELRPGRIPRREHEEQRRLKEDLRKVLPIVALWAVPFIGTALVLFPVLIPRQTLSRQFFNPYEKELYAAIEYRQCQSHFYALGDFVFTSAMISAKRLDTSKLKEDAAGPVLDLMPFYVMFTDSLPEKDDKKLSLAIGKACSFRIVSSRALDRFGFGKRLVSTPSRLIEHACSSSVSLAEARNTSNRDNHC